MKRVFFLFFISYLLFLATPVVYAEYVLPYPSFMPGNKIYKITRALDTLKGYWHMGNLAKTKYHLGLSDKYLVEAKTLFEYKQYLLAVDALSRSNAHMQMIDGFLDKAQSEGKDTTLWKESVKEAKLAHIEVLEAILIFVPESFEWRPEKDSPTSLSLHDLLEESILMRVAR